MLDILPDTHDFPATRKLLLDRLEGRDGARAVALTEEVEGEEAREVLECS